MDNVRVLISRARGRVATAAGAYDTLKTAVFLYLLLTQALKVHRHLRARGIVATTKDLWQWAARVRVKFQTTDSIVDTHRSKLFCSPYDYRLIARRSTQSWVKRGSKLRASLSRRVPMSLATYRFQRQAKHLNGSSKKWLRWTRSREARRAGSKAKFPARSTVRHRFWHPQLPTYKISLLDGGDDLTRVIIDAFARYTVSNPLHPDVFPAIRKMDAEVVAMCLRMYNNPNGAGTTTSGGTESILLSIRAHRAWARATKGIVKPELYVSCSCYCLMHIDIVQSGSDIGTRHVLERGGVFWNQDSCYSGQSYHEESGFEENGTRDVSRPTANLVLGERMLTSRPVTLTPSWSSALLSTSPTAVRMISLISVVSRRSTRSACTWIVVSEASSCRSLRRQASRPIHSTSGWKV